MHTKAPVPRCSLSEQLLFPWGNSPVVSLMKIQGEATKRRRVITPIHMTLQAAALGARLR